MKYLWLLGLLACFSAQKEAAESSEETDETEDTDEIEDTEVEEIDDLSWVDPAELPAGSNPCREPVRVLVESVLDGDTFIGQGDDGEERVRIIGVDTPELSSGDCYAQEAKSFLIDQIFGRWVWLTFDGNCYDIYDRTLAYVHLGVNEQDFVERQILLGGYAQAFPFSDTATFEDVFAQDETTARENNVGGWAACGW